MKVHREAPHARPGWCRASTSWLHLSKKDVDGRDESPAMTKKRIIFNYWKSLNAFAARLVT
jgi:hypothetical protein